MNKEEQKGKLKELLDKLQQESWQLELLISGFAIYGLVGALESIKNYHNEAVALESYYTIFYIIARFSCYILIVNLIIHVILRGLWIGAIGLRYVSNEIDYEELNYSKRFTNYLKRKVGSFDDYIGKLENYCSILFAVTFLTLFYFIALFTCIFFVFFLATKFFVNSGIFSEFLGMLFLGWFGILYILISFIVFFDFITQGLLKKKEWTSFLYMPIYKVFSYLTLSFLYRPLVYNFLDNKFGRRISFILVPLYIAIFYISTLDNVRSNYLLLENKSTANHSKESNYFNLLKENEFVKNVAIQSKIIEKPYIEIFIPFKEKIENLILERNKSLKPLEDHRGLSSGLFKNFKRRKNRTKNDLKNQFQNKKTDSIYTIYLKTFNSTYLLKIDSISIPSDFIVTNINHQLGFETVLPLKDFVEGKHTLTIDKIGVDKKTKEEIKVQFAKIPFWYYKN